jgi:hypothetical protein
MLRHVALISLAALASVMPPTPAVATTLDYQGYAFESGGFPPSTPGDTLWLPVVVTTASESLQIDFGVEELTGWIAGLVSNGPQDGGDAVQFFTFAPGRIEFYRDSSRDHDFGTDPPNATVPSTFTNGTLCLGGTITDFTLFFDTDTNTGAYEGQVVFDTGECLDAFNAIRAEGYTFGGVFTRAALGDVVLAGYDLQVDGYLEARKVVESPCDVDCFGIESARFDFPRRNRHDRDDDDDDGDDDARANPSHGLTGSSGSVLAASGARGTGLAQDGDRDRDRDKDRKFRIEGEFVPCDDVEGLDPEAVEVEITIGDYTQTLPEGTIRPGRRRDCDNDVDGPCWVYSNSRGEGTITRFTMQLDEDEGEWDFEVQGRGIKRSKLISDGNLLDFTLGVDGEAATTQAQLVQKRDRLRFVRHRDACGPESARPAPDLGAPLPAPETGAVVAVLGAAPNPMRDATTIVLQAPAGHAADLRLRIYDVRGRLVRALYAGAVGAGEHRFAWDGRDERGARVANGIYVYLLQGGARVEARKLVVAR